MEALLAFGAALLALRLAGMLAARRRERPCVEPDRLERGPCRLRARRARRSPGVQPAGWNDGVFRAYYLFGGLLTAALLGTGSLLGAGVRIAGPVALVYTGLSIGVALAVPTRGAPSRARRFRRPRSTWRSSRPAVLAIVGNVAGSLALVAVALAGLRRRPVGNTLLLAGFAVAAAGSALAGLGAAETAAFVAAGGDPALRGHDRASMSPFVLLTVTYFLQTVSC